MIWSSNTIRVRPVNAASASADTIKALRIGAAAHASANQLEMARMRSSRMTSSVRLDFRAMGATSSDSNSENTSPMATRFPIALKAGASAQLSDTNPTAVVRCASVTGTVSFRKLDRMMVWDR